MNRKISRITKKDIKDIFTNGIEDAFFVFDVVTIKYNYFGTLNEIEFLKRLYDLENMPSEDNRYKNAEDDIFQHTVNNDDYENGWVFTDKRFGLEYCDDEEYLKFICEIFDPYVRDEKKTWKIFFDAINELLKIDGYELYCCKKISNREKYGWKIYCENKIVQPYSIRNDNKIISKEIKLSIPNNARYQINKVLNEFDYREYKTTEMGFNYYELISEEVFNEISTFYSPRHYSENNKTIPSTTIENLIIEGGSPYKVLDIIELFSRKINNEKFNLKINNIFKLNKLMLYLDNGLIDNIIDSKFKNIDVSQVQEVGLEILLEEANNYYDEGNFNVAVEKLWDAFERLKTYYKGLDKKKSAGKIVKDMSCDNDNYYDMFNKEFAELTKIGNDFRIRHHEMNKIDIIDNRHYDYFYRRCLSLISVAVLFLDER